MVREPLQTQRLPEYPGLLDEPQTLKHLGYNKWEGRFLIKARHLKPTGTPRKRTKRMFVTAYVLELMDDADWHSDARDIIRAAWRKINARKHGKLSQDA
jgi:hypothetical protein